MPLNTLHFFLFFLGVKNSDSEDLIGSEWCLSENSCWIVRTSIRQTMWRCHFHRSMPGEYWRFHMVWPNMGINSLPNYSAKIHDMDKLFSWIVLIFEGAASRWLDCFIPILPFCDTRWKQTFSSPSCGFWSLHCLLDKMTENTPRCSVPQPTRQLCSGYIYVHVQDHVLTTGWQQLPPALTRLISVQVPFRWPIQLGRVAALIVVYCVMQGDYSTWVSGQRGSESSGRLLVN